MTIENLKIKSLLQLIIEQRVKININVFVRHENHLKKKKYMCALSKEIRELFVRYVSVNKYCVSFSFYYGGLIKLSSSKLRFIVVLLFT